MRTILLIVEYDGTNYVGWQIQPNGLSIQQVIEEALASLIGESVRIFSSGRTDAGVHAKGMPACFQTTSRIPVRAFSAGLNSFLPPDISIREAWEVPENFHPRREATAKHYCYTLQVGVSRSPLRRLYAWHLRGPLDIVAMRAAAAHLVGEKDFASFRASGCAAKTTIRTIYRVDIAEEDEALRINIIGTGFLRNMVRIIAGTLVEVGRGRRKPDTVLDLLERPDRSSAGVTAPPQGLCLMKVFFNNEPDCRKILDR